MNLKIDNLRTIADSRGWLVPVDFSWLPFKPKHMFYLTCTPYGTVRGNHAHYKTRQYIVCIQGKVEAMLFDGNNYKNFALNSSQAVLVEAMVWGSYKFVVAGTTLLVISSLAYDERDYIRDLKDFTEAVLNKK